METKEYECDCGFKWLHGQNGSHQCEPYYRKTIADLRAALAQREASQQDGDTKSVSVPEKAMYWFSCLAKCARLLGITDDTPIPSGVVAEVEKLVAKRADSVPDSERDAVKAEPTESKGPSLYESLLAMPPEERLAIGYEITENSIMYHGVGSPPPPMTAEEYKQTISEWKAWADTLPPLDEMIAESRNKAKSVERDAARYREVRTWSARKFTDVWELNIAGKGAFDDLVDAAMAAQQGEKG